MPLHAWKTEFFRGGEQYFGPKQTIPPGLSPIPGTNVGTMLKTKKKKNRRVEKRNVSNKNVQQELTLVGVNAAGLSSKLYGFDKLLEDITPGVFFIEETKMRKEGRIKTAHSSNYQIFGKFKNTKIWVLGDTKTQMN